MAVGLSDYYLLIYINKLFFVCYNFSNTFFQIDFEIKNRILKEIRIPSYTYIVNDVMCLINFILFCAQDMCL